MNNVRLADIAERVGVSIVTVHNALAGRRGVSDEVRDKILREADAMGYQQKRPAPVRDKSRRLKHIGVIISEKYLADYTTYYWKMYQEMAIAATDKNCIVAVEVLRHETEDHLILPRMLEEDTVDGLIVLGAIHREYIALMQENTDIPLVFLDYYDCELARNAVVADDFYGMYQMTEYLFERGFQELAYVGSIHATSSIMDRYCGFYKAMLEHGKQPRQDWLMEDRDEIGYIHLALPEEMPQAFVCNCDLVAGMLIRELEKKGYRVPEDISVVGFDNYVYPGFPDKQVTTYEPDMKAMAAAALDKALKQIKNPESAGKLEVISGRIVEKNSVRDAASPYSGEKSAVSQELMSG